LATLIFCMKIGTFSFNEGAKENNPRRFRKSKKSGLS
jgi:hypothetical protein